MGRTLILLAVLQASSGLWLSRGTELLATRRLRGGAVDEAEAPGAEAPAASAGSPGPNSEEIQAAMDNFSAALDTFLAKFKELDDRVRSTSKAGFFGTAAGPETLADRPDRVAFREAYEHLAAVRSLLGEELSSAERLPFVTSSMQLLRQAALLLGDEADGISTTGVPAATLSRLQALRSACRQKPKRSVAQALDELKEALIPPIEAHKQLLAGIGYKRPEPVQAALTRDEITEKLNAVPTFCLLNKDGFAVTVRGEDGSPTCSWYTDPSEARAVLAAAIRDNPTVPGLHLGVAPLGIAFSTCGGWPEDPPSAFMGTLKVQGNRAVVKGMEPFLASQLKEQGLPAATWHLPVFCCDQLQSATAMPMFLSRSDLVEAWVLSGREEAEVPETLTVMDLHLLVHQMQTDKFAWNTVDLLCSRRAVELVDEAKEQAKAVIGERTGNRQDDD